MRRRWGLTSFLCLVFAPAIAAAQAADVVGSVAPAEEDPAPSQVVGYGALPGGLHAPSAETLPKGTVQVTTLGGYGFRSGLLGEDHKMTRGIGNLAVAFAPHELLTLGLSLDGRYDKHSGIGSDDGYVGDPHLMIRAAKASGNLRFGGQLGVWVPGKDAPSVAGSAISVDVRALVALKAGPGWLSIDAGFRLDNSAKSVDDPTRLSVQDRVSLGVSEFNAVVAGAHLGIPVGSKAFVGLEGSLDLFIGEGDTPMGATAAHSAPGPLIRFGATAGYHLSKQYSILAFVEGAKVPGLGLSAIGANDIKLIAYEPVFTAGLGFQARFGGPKGPAGDIKRNEDPKDIILVETANVSGEVVDETGKPIVGAKVDVVLKNNTGTAVTDDKGVFTVEKLPIGKTVKAVTTLDDTAAEVNIVVSGKKPSKTTLTLLQGRNAVPRITLDPELPPGQLRALVRSVVTGKPLPGATVKIEPGGKTATSGADGTFEVDLQPGSYKITVSSPGLADQVLDVTIDPNGVAIKNIELHK